ncbi:shikimate kinase [Halobacteriovorax sp.]|uniref:shikimate kinase n=1 Tax=Halobacteriovorax sp. TaxID=2020862 RepID=UPI00356435A4
MIIAVCGFMGAGKSSFLRMYPEVNSIDLDTFMSEKLDCKLGDFIRDNGWDKFRDYESESLELSLQSLGKEGLLSLGGGSLDREANRDFLHKYGAKILHLSVDFDEAMARIEGDENRPQLDKSREELLELYKTREDLFKKVSDFSLPSQADVWPTNWTVFKTFF